MIVTKTEGMLIVALMDVDVALSSDPILETEIDLMGCEELDASDLIEVLPGQTVPAKAAVVNGPKSYDTQIEQILLDGGSLADVYAYVLHVSK